MKKRNKKNKKQEESYTIGEAGPAAQDPEPAIPDHQLRLMLAHEVQPGYYLDGQTKIKEVCRVTWLGGEGIKFVYERPISAFEGGGMSGIRPLESMPMRSEAKVFVSLAPYPYQWPTPFPDTEVRSMRADELRPGMYLDGLTKITEVCRVVEYGQPRISVKTGSPGQFTYRLSAPVTASLAPRLPAKKSEKEQFRDGLLMEVNLKVRAAEEQRDKCVDRGDYGAAHMQTIRINAIKSIYDIVKYVR